jgi:hypothetical protein
MIASILYRQFRCGQDYIENMRKSICRYRCVRILNAANFIAEDAEDKACVAGPTEEDTISKSIAIFVTGAASPLPNFSDSSVNSWPCSSLSANSDPPSRRYLLRLSNPNFAARFKAKMKM